MRENSRGLTLVIICAAICAQAASVSAQTKQSSQSENKGKVPVAPSQKLQPVQFPAAPTAPAPINYGNMSGTTPSTIQQKPQNQLYNSVTPVGPAASPQKVPAVQFPAAPTSPAPINYGNMAGTTPSTIPQKNQLYNSVTPVGPAASPQKVQPIQFPAASTSPAPINYGTMAGTTPSGVPQKPQNQLYNSVTPVGPAASPQKVQPVQFPAAPTPPAPINYGNMAGTTPSTIPQKPHHQSVAPPPSVAAPSSVQPRPQNGQFSSAATQPNFGGMAATPPNQQAGRVTSSVGTMTALTRQQQQASQAIFGGQNAPVTANFLASGPSKKGDPNYVNQYVEGATHAGTDFGVGTSTKVYSPVTGRIVYYNTTGGPSQTVVVVRDDKTRQDYVLGHISCAYCSQQGMAPNKSVPEQATVRVQAGTYLGNPLDQGTNTHVHLGVNSSQIVDQNGHLKSQFQHGKWGSVGQKNDSGSTYQQQEQEIIRDNWVDPLR